MPLASDLTDIAFDESTGRLAELYAPVFSLILQVRETAELGEAGALRARAKALLDKTRREAIRTGVVPEDVRAAEFAVVAFLDEALLSSEWAERGQWMSQPLQLELYDRYDAGEAFFDRLAELRQSPGLHAEALEVYYLCMALGFKGRHQLQGQDLLRRTIEETAADLARQPGMQAGVLAPNGRPREAAATEARARVPAWAVIAAALVLGAVLYLGASLFASSAATDAADDIEAMAAAPPATAL